MQLIRLLCARARQRLGCRAQKKRQSYGTRWRRQCEKYCRSRLIILNNQLCRGAKREDAERISRVLALLQRHPQHMCTCLEWGCCSPWQLLSSGICTAIALWIIIWCARHIFHYLACYYLIQDSYSPFLEIQTYGHKIALVVNHVNFPL